MSQHVSGIYAIRNLLTGQTYIGSSCNIKSRWFGHLSGLRRGLHHSHRLQRAWNIYGETSFSFEVLEIVINESELFEAEQRWMDKTCCFAKSGGYNMHPNAGGPRGWKASAELKARLSILRKGKPMPPRSKSHRDNMSKSKKGIRLGPRLAEMSQAHKDAIRESKIGRKASEETRAKLSRLRAGKALSHNHALKTREVLIARNKSDQMRAIVAERNSSQKMRDLVALRNQTRLITDSNQIEMSF